ncbi:hypothetical protein CVT24_006530 [Panaeolus cyanescens]|uniref:Major facilitator superfamily (MFS) profile domain-containing protein n=1 Tax=Panaeolus cyanescens TaxID=181874 RepID=A0A409VZT6_9AGAR|nr:hypothetical protein CVT24_006530 [Panaeolus cyanescens]
MVQLHETESKRLRLSPYFTILAAGFGFLSDGYQNTLMTMGNVVFRKIYPKEYTSAVSTRVSNASLVGEPFAFDEGVQCFTSPISPGTIIGQILVGLLCDRVGRKSAMVLTTALIVLGAILATASHGVNGSASSLFWFLTIASIFSASIISNVIHDGDLKRTAEFQLLLTSLALPGTVLGAFLCNPFGRRRTMMLGFAGYMWSLQYGAIGLILGLAYDKITQIIPLFVVMYGLMQSVGHMGPGDMLGLVVSNLYQVMNNIHRGTCYGLSAAFGKLGAAVGTQIFKPIQEHLGKKWTFIIAAICGAVGIIVSYFLVPDMTGIDLADEDEKFLKCLADNGWKGFVGEAETNKDDDASVSKASS